MTRPTVSFEFFPPKTDHGRAHLLDTVRDLAVLGPSFMTVTYGAGGSTRAWTQHMAVRIQEETKIPTAAHLTCVNTSREGITDIARDLWAGGVKHIVALRGDIPKEDAPLNYKDFSYYHYANELISGLKTLHDFEISVAAYPEKHPEAPDLQADILNLKRKCEAGAARAITQFFFDVDVYLNFVELAQAAGIRTPIVPGLLPVADFGKMLRFAASCQANVPEWMHDRFAGLEDRPEEAARVGAEILTEQCRKLIAAGASHIHFYTLNRADLTAEACKANGLTV